MQDRFARVQCNAFSQHNVAKMQVGYPGNEAVMQDRFARIHYNAFSQHYVAKMQVGYPGKQVVMQDRFARIHYNAFSQHNVAKMQVGYPGNQVEIMHGGNIDAIRLLGFNTMQFRNIMLRKCKKGIPKTK